MIDSIISRLSDSSAGDTPWLSVEGLLDLSELESRSQQRFPKLYVIELTEHARPDVRGSGPALQSLQAEIGVICLMSKRNGACPSLWPLREAVRSRLFGFVPQSGNNSDSSEGSQHGYEPLWLNGGGLLKINAGHVAWLDKFMTEYTAQAAQ
ncbi:hypothetical protein [uncultured Shewanella sp.]|uniref:phage tail terminator protein n=1 Tax=uncultured Shewanella sp. TaxID=173975 RepID=UPI002621D32C|nr:hypothetical protein [uncultured Shewanella sp.]